MNYQDSIKELRNKLKSRYEAMKSENGEDMNRSLITLIINASEYYSYISVKRDIVSAFKQILTTYKSLGVCVILSDMQGVPNIGAPELVRMVKENRCFIVFDNLKEQHLFDVSTKTQHKFHNKLKEDEAYFVDKTSLCKIKIPTIDEV